MPELLSYRNRLTEASGTGINVVRNFPKGTVTVLLFPVVMEVSGAGIIVIPMLPKCQVLGSLPYGTEHLEVVGTGVDIAPNLHE